MAVQMAALLDRKLVETWVQKTESWMVVQLDWMWVECWAGSLGAQSVAQMVEKRA